MTTIILIIITLRKKNNYRLTYDSNVSRSQYNRHGEATRIF